MPIDSVPVLLRVYPKDILRKNVRVRQRVRTRIHLLALQRIQRCQQVILREVVEDEVNRGVVRKSRRRVRARVVGRGEEGLSNKG